jgi:hypothetical protein
MPLPIHFRCGLRPRYLFFLASASASWAAASAADRVSQIFTRPSAAAASVARHGLTPLNHHGQSFLQSAQQTFQQWTGDPSRSRLMGVVSLDQLRQQQALSLSYFDVFWIGVIVSAALVILVLLLKRSVTEKGEHISAE